MGQFDHLPPNMRAAAEEQMRLHDLNAMRQEEITRQIDSFYQTASDEDLFAVLMMLNRIAITLDADPAQAQFTLGHQMGQAYATAVGQRGMCIRCGARHGVEPCPLDQREQPIEAMVTEAPTDKPGDEQPESYKAACEEYNVSPDPDGTGSVFCMGCGLVYVSLADRMLKGVDGCHGCHHKSAHG